MTSPLFEQLQRALGATHVMERELGGGGMARVFLATETALNRRVVVKVLDAEVSAAVNVERFTREMSVAAQLRHPNITPVLGAGRDGGVLFYTMPFIEGESLRAWLVREPQLPVGTAMRFAREVAEALEHAHAHGVIHRDIKPENILIDDGRAMLTDFGIASAVEATGGPRLTATGTSIGSPMYMSPEQASGESRVDARSDLYSLGCVLYEMLAGEPPFTGPTVAAVIAKRFAQPAASVRILRQSVSPAVEEIVVRSLQRTPADRWQGATELVRAIRDAERSPLTLTGSAGAVSPAGPAAAPRPARRWLRRIGIGAAIGVPSLAFVGFVSTPAPVRATLRTLVTRGAPTVVAHRVVVAQFENDSGDSTLTPLGAMAADLIAQALARTRRLDVVDGRSAQLASRIVSRTPRLLRTGDQALALAEETGAGLVLAGSYYVDGDTLRVTARLIDVPTRRILYALDPVSGPVSSPARVIEMLRVRAVGALAAVVDPTIGHAMTTFSLPPSYDAYQQLYRGMDAYYQSDTTHAYEALGRALRLDTTFLAPRVMLAVMVAEGGGYSGRAWQRADSIVRSLQPVADRLTPGERAVLDRLRGTLDGDREAMLRASRELARLSPGSAEWIVTLASASITADRPAEALAALKQTDPTRGFNLVSDYYWANLCSALHQLGRLDEQLKAARQGLDQFPEREGVTTCEVQALAALGRLAELRAPLERRLLLPPDADRAHLQRRLQLFAVRELRAHGHVAQGDTLAGELVATWARVAAADTAKPARLDRAQLFTLAGRFREAMAELQGLVARDTSDARLLGAYGVAAERANDHAAAAAIDARLAAFSAPWDFGGAPYARARLAAFRGDKARALEFLRDASQRGHPLHFSFARRVLDAHSDEAFEALRRDPEFVRLLAPVQ